MGRQIWVTNKWNYGIWEGDKLGPEGSFLRCQSVDIRTQPDSVTVLGKSSKESGTTVTDLVKWIVKGSDGNNYLLDNSKKLYKRTASKVWSLINTDANAGSGNGLGYYNDYIYYAGNTTVGRYGALSGTPSVSDSWKTGLTSATWHPMIAFKDLFLIGHGRYIASWDGATWTLAKLTLPPDYTIKCFEQIGNFVAIGTFRGTNIYDEADCRMFLWDGESSFYNSYVDLHEAGVNSLLNIGNLLLVSAGLNGNQYIYDGASFTKVTHIPDIEDGTYQELFPQNLTVFGGIPRIGMSGMGTSTAALKGVWSYGKNLKDYPSSLTFDYPASTGTTTGTGMKIGAVKPFSATELAFGFADGSTYGVDVVQTTPFSTATLDTHIFDGGAPLLRKTFFDVVVTMKALRTSESIAVQYKLDRASSWTTYGTASYASNGAITQKKFSNIPLHGYDLQLRVVFTSSSTTAPTLYSVSVSYETEPLK